MFYRVFSHDVTVAILVSQTNPLRAELFSYANAFFCSKKFALMPANVIENTLLNWHQAGVISISVDMIRYSE